jgi:hypothetical protein
MTGEPDQFLELLAQQLSARRLLPILSVAAVAAPVLSLLVVVAVTLLTAR